MHDVFAAPSGGLARVRLGDPDAPRVVLVSGVAGSKEDFILLFPLFAAAGYRVESYDIAGHYGSVEAGPQNLDPPREHYDYRLFVDDLIAILEDGRDAGARARLQLRRSRRRARARRAAGPVRESDAHVRAAGDRARCSAASSTSVRSPTCRRTAPPGSSCGGSATTSIARRRCGSRSCGSGWPSTGRPAIDDIVGLMMTMPDIADEVAAIDIPKFIAVGEQDLWPEEQHPSYAERIGARIAVYPTGHAPCETAPHQLVRDMLALFTSR